MKIFGISTPKPRRFEYKPVFYNPEKEKAEIAKDRDSGLDLHVRLREEFKHNRRNLDRKIRSKSTFSSLIMLILMLLILLYVIFLR